MNRNINRNPLNPGTLIGQIDEFGRLLLPQLPWLPEAPLYGEEGPTKLLKEIYDKNTWPKIILSRNYAYEYYTPSEFIGSIV